MSIVEQNHGEEQRLPKHETILTGPDILVAVEETVAVYVSAGGMFEDDFFPGLGEPIDEWMLFESLNAECGAPAFRGTGMIEGHR